MLVCGFYDKTLRHCTIKKQNLNPKFTPQEQFQNKKKKNIWNKKSSTHEWILLTSLRLISQPWVLITYLITQRKAIEYKIYTENSTAKIMSKQTKLINCLISLYCFVVSIDVLINFRILFHRIQIAFNQNQNLKKNLQFYLDPA